MPIGMESSDGEKEKILNAVNEAWGRWERGENLPEIIDDLDGRPMALDYFPPDPDLLRRAITISFTGKDPGSGNVIVYPFGPSVPPLRSFIEHIDRKDYRLLGVAGEGRWSWEESLSARSWGKTILNLFALSEDKGRDIWESAAPTMRISLDWPPALSSRSSDFWDFETTLGCYNPRENAIVLFSRGIRRCAKALALSNMDLALIVWLHEIAHWCVHRYPVIDYEPAWDTDAYIKASANVHETLAQWICWHCIRDYPSLERSFDKLRQRQTRRYSLYEEIAGADRERVIASVGSLRRSETLSGDYERWRESLLT